MPAKTDSVKRNSGPTRHHENGGPVVPGEGDVSWRRFVECVRLRVARRVRISGDCWIWSGAKSTRGYGEFKIDGRRWFVHRWAYAQCVGRIPDGHFICHRCDNPACVNPNHLWSGTVQDNNQDKAAKGRCYRGGARRTTAAALVEPGSSSEPLTARQKDALAFITTFIADNGFAPTVREVASGIGATLNTTQAHIYGLEAKGAIRRRPGVARSIVVAVRP